MCGSCYLYCLVPIPDVAAVSCLSALGNGSDFSAFGLDQSWCPWAWASTSLGG